MAFFGNFQLLSCRALRDTEQLSVALMRRTGIFVYPSRFLLKRAIVKSAHTPVPVTTYLKLVAVALFWGGTFIAGRIVASEIPHMTAAALRFAVASGLLWLLAWKLEGGLPKLTRQQMQATFALGATGIFLYNICFFQHWH
jgi:hypothetical protein